MSYLRGAHSPRRRKTSEKHVPALLYTKAAAGRKTAKHDEAF